MTSSDIRHGAGAKAASDGSGNPAAPLGDRPAESPELAELVRAAVRDELDGILPHVVAAVKRDRAFDALSVRLRDAERRLDARRERPVAVALLRCLNRLRHLEFDAAIRDSLELEIVEILSAAGFEEMGAVGERYDPARHEALGGRTVDGEGAVAEVHASGLTSFGDVVVRAQVRVGPDSDAAAQAGAAHRQNPLARQRNGEL